MSILFSYLVLACLCPVYCQFYGHFIISTSDKSIGKSGMAAFCSNMEARGIFSCKHYWNVGAAGSRGVRITDTAMLLLNINNMSNILFSETKDDYMILSAGSFLGPTISTSSVPRRKLLEDVQELPPKYFDYLGLNSMSYTYTRLQHPAVVYLIGGDMNIEDPEFKLSTFDNTSRASRAFPPPITRTPCTTELGTHLASLISGLKHGLSKDAKIINVSLLELCSEDVRTSKVVSALDWIIENSSSYKKVIVVIPIQIRGESKIVVNDMVQELLDAGAIVIAAAGNSAEDACGFSPSCLPGVITVAAAHMINSTYGTPWFNSNFGSCVTLWAPGNDIEATSTMKANTTSVFSGTGQAMAIVAGIVAGIDYNFTSNGITNLLIKYSKRNIVSHLPPNTTSLLVQLVPFTNVTGGCP